MMTLYHMATKVLGKNVAPSDTHSIGNIHFERPQVAPRSIEAPDEASGSGGHMYIRMYTHSLSV